MNDMMIKIKLANKIKHDLLEPTLIKEIECTLKRNKAICDINDSLLKKSEITFMFLTFSSLAVARNFHQ
jgi:hypothetical protein